MCKTNKIILVTTVIMILTIVTNAEIPPKEEWNRTLETSGYITSVRQTTDDGYIITGIIHNLSNSVASLIKTDKNGNKVWEMTHDNITANNYFSNVQQTYDGSYIISGWWDLFGEPVMYY